MGNFKITFKNDGQVLKALYVAKSGRVTATEPASCAGMIDLVVLNPILAHDAIAGTRITVMDWQGSTEVLEPVVSKLEVAEI